MRARFRTTKKRNVEERINNAGQTSKFDAVSLRVGVENSKRRKVSRHYKPNFNQTLSKPLTAGISVAKPTANAIQIRVTGLYTQYFLP